LRNDSKIRGNNGEWNRRAAHFDHQLTEPAYVDGFLTW